jgi:hypothetical protein
MSLDHSACSREDRLGWPNERIAELLLFLPGPQAAKLERLAFSRDLSVGQLIRLLIRDYLIGQKEKSDEPHRSDTV